MCTEEVFGSDPPLVERPGAFVAQLDAVSNSELRKLVVLHEVSDEGSKDCSKCDNQQVFAHGVPFNRGLTIRNVNLAISKNLYTMPLSRKHRRHVRFLSHTFCVATYDESVCSVDFVPEVTGSSGHHMGMLVTDDH